MKVVCPKCRKPVEQSELEVHAAGCKGATESKARKPRVVKNPARYVLMKMVSAAEIPEGQAAYIEVGAAKGPALAEKAVHAEKIAGRILCFRGPVWEREYGVQQVFGVIEK